MRSFAKLQLTKRNVVKLGGELASDQRLSGLARERSERTQCQVKKSGAKERARAKRQSALGVQCQT
uniref:Uncharacterized protein n=1 Tax=OCS116 cluster bacterium TaxID=2030921 RepID=A0A2A4Z3W2_9PROT